MTAYLGFIGVVSTHLHDRLGALQKQYNLYEETATKVLEDSLMHGVNLAALQFESGVMDGPVIHSRAGLYVYLNASVSLQCSKSSTGN